METKRSEKSGRSPLLSSNEDKGSCHQAARELNGSLSQVGHSKGTKIPHLEFSRVFHCQRCASNDSGVKLVNIAPTRSEFLPTCVELIAFHTWSCTQLFWTSF